MLAQQQQCRCNSTETPQLAHPCVLGGVGSAFTRDHQVVALAIRYLHMCCSFPPVKIVTAWTRQTPFSSFCTLLLATFPEHSCAARCKRRYGGLDGGQVLDCENANSRFSLCYMIVTETCSEGSPMQPCKTPST